MGIKNLSKFLKDRHKEVFEEIHLSTYAYKKVAIDTSLYLCNYKALYGDDWLRAFIRLVTVLRENEIHCAFTYDTKAPPEKMEERKNRAESREKMYERIDNIETAVEKYDTEGEISDVLLDFQKKRKISPPKLGAKVNIHTIKFMLEKMKKQAFSISKEDFELTKKLFDILKVPYFNAPMEAETMASDLCKQGKVDAVLSEDTDVLAYGCPVFLTKINTYTGTCFRIRLEKVLESMEFTYDQFLDFCIMCGTDYNKNIFKLGPVKAYSLISEYKSIDNLPLNIDKTILNHNRVRELFKDYEKSGVKVPYCDIPDFNALQELSFKKNIKMDFKKLEESYKAKIVLIED